MITVSKLGNATCSECGTKYKKEFAICTSYSQAKWKFLCKDCYSKLEKETESKKVYDMQYPIGIDFIQYPDMENPNEMFQKLFPETEWERNGEWLGLPRWHRIK